MIALAIPHKTKIRIFQDALQFDREVRHQQQPVRRDGFDLLQQGEGDLVATRIAVCVK